MALYKTTYLLTYLLTYLITYLLPVLLFFSLTINEAKVPLIKLLSLKQLQHIV